MRTPKRPGVFCRLFGWLVCPLPPVDADASSRAELEDVEQRVRMLEAKARVVGRRR